MNTGAIQKMIDAGKLDAKGTLDHDALKGAGLARGGKDGVRLLGKGELKAKLALKVAGASKGRARRSKRPAAPSKSSSARTRRACCGEKRARFARAPCRSGCRKA